MGKKRKYSIELENRIIYTVKVKARNEDEAIQKAWEQGPAPLTLPEGFSLEDASAWEVY